MLLDCIKIYNDKGSEPKLWMKIKSRVQEQQQSL